ncbi:hypothetical protein COJ48_04125 [Bacillus cereus]|nr:hypothetical protein COJ48_04125 [Bacillus cereus]
MERRHQSGFFRFDVFILETVPCFANKSDDIMNTTKQINEYMPINYRGVYQNIEFENVLFMRFYHIKRAK